MNLIIRKCACGCGQSIDHKHKNAKFFNQRHKDKHHNVVNPRGIYAHLKGREKYLSYDESRHPFDLE